MNKGSINIGFIGILVWLFIIQFNRFISMIFVLNFSTTGLNITAAISLLFILPGIVFYFVEKLGILPNKRYNIILTMLLPVFGIAGLFFTAFLKSIFSALTLTVVSLLLIDFSRIEQENYTLGIATGLVTHITTVMLFVGLSPFATTIGKLTLGVFLLLPIIFIILLGDGIYENEVNYHKWGLTAILLTYASLYIANPFVIAVWTFDSSVIWIKFLIDLKLRINLYSGLLSISGILSILSFNYLMNTKLSIEMKGYQIYFGFILSSISIMIFPVFVLIFYMVNIVCVLFLIHRVSQNKEHKVGIKAIGLLFLLLILTFLHTISGHWAFLPEVIHIITKGMAGIYIMGIVVLVVIFSELYERREVNE